MTRFPNLYAVLTGNAPDGKTPPGQRRGSTPRGANQKDSPMLSTTEAVRKVSTFIPDHDYTQPISTEHAQLLDWVKLGKKGVFTTVATVTPDLARLLLASNENNRNIQWTGSTRSVGSYAAMMTRGEWVLNGESIIVARDGQLNDGQHRLHAVIQAQTPVQMLLTIGVGRNTRHTVDQGIARTPGQILAMAGEANSNQLASTLQFMFAHDNGLTFNARPSMDQLLETLRDNPDAREAVTAVGKLSSHYRLSGGYIAAAHLLCRRHQHFSADHYLDALTTGLNITNANSPVARLRRQFEDHRAQLKGHKMDRVAQAALYIKGFNNFLKGRTGALQFRVAGASPENFPSVGA